MHLGCSSDAALEARAAMSSPTDQDADFPPLVMTFAASDPSGGAGIQADILTLASMGCHPLSVLTAITVQDTMGVEALQAIDADWVADQARLQDTVIIGVHRDAVVECVAGFDH